MKKVLAVSALRVDGAFCLRFDDLVRQAGDSILVVMVTGVFSDTIFRLEDHVAV